MRQINFFVIWVFLCKTFLMIKSIEIVTLDTHVIRINPFFTDVTIDIVNVNVDSFICL